MLRWVAYLNPHNKTHVTVGLGVHCLTLAGVSDAVFPTAGTTLWVPFGRSWDDEKFGMEYDLQFGFAPFYIRMLLGVSIRVFK
jgi:hypothetical protein